MTARRMVRKAELDSVLASLKKAQMHARIEIEPGRMIVTTGQAASAPLSNPLDYMFS